MGRFLDQNHPSRILCVQQNPNRIWYTAVRGAVAFAGGPAVNKIKPVQSNRFFLLSDDVTSQSSSKSVQKKRMKKTDSGFNLPKTGKNESPAGSKLPSPLAFRKPINLNISGDVVHPQQLHRPLDHGQSEGSATSSLDFEAGQDEEFDVAENLLEYINWLLLSLFASLLCYKWTQFGFIGSLAYRILVILFFSLTSETFNSITAKSVAALCHVLLFGKLIETL